MEKALQLDIVTPDSVVLSDQVQYVSARGVEGEFGVLPGHFQFLAALDIGCLCYTTLKGDKKRAFVGGGFAEILNDKVTILAESSELAEDIDQARAMQARERAEKRLENKTDEINVDRAQAALHRAITRINVRSETW